MSAKRYDMEYVGRAYMEERQMVEREDGEWVRWEDYEALRSRNAELEEALRQTESSARLRWANHRIEELERQVGRLRSILRPFAVSAVKGGGDVPPEADWQRVAEEMGVEP